MKLLRSQKNQLADIFLSSGIDLKKIKIEEKQPNPHESYFTTTISYNNSEYFFEMSKDYEESSSDIIMRICPGTELWEYTFDDCNGWDEAQQMITFWIERVKLEINEPDKWQQYISQADNFKLKEVANDFFSSDELEQLITGMALLKNRIKMIGLTEEKVMVIEEKLDQILEHGKNMSKIDWRNLLIGTLMAFVADNTLTVEFAHKIWVTATQCFNIFFLPPL